MAPIGTTHGRNGWSWNERSFASPQGAAHSPNPEATGRSQTVRRQSRGVEDHQHRTHLPTMDNRYIDEWNGPNTGWVGLGYELL